MNYEDQPEFPLKRIENKNAKLDWRVEAMKLTKDRSSLIYNDWLTLAGIPATEAVLATLLYRLASYWLPVIAGPIAYGIFRFTRARQNA